MTFAARTFAEHGVRRARVFPPSTHMLVSVCTRLGALEKLLQPHAEADLHADSADSARLLEFALAHWVIAGSFLRAASTHAACLIGTVTSNGQR